MLRKLGISLSLVLCFVLHSCKNEPVQKEIVIPDLTPDSLSVYIEKQFGTWTELICQDQLPYIDTLKVFYAERNYKPLWWNALLGDSAAYANVKASFLNSHFHGMDYRYYYLPLIDYYSEIARATSNQDSTYLLLAELDIILSNSMLKMYNDIANGRTDPKSVYGYTYMLPRNNVKKTDLFGFLSEQDKIGWINTIHEGDTTYNELLNLMNYYQKQNQQALRNAIDFSEHPKLEIGDSAEVVRLVVQRLKARNLPDKSIHQLADTAVFSKELAEQIKKLQEMYSLTPDGIMGFKTYKIINASPTDKINKIKTNLERQRWFKKPKKGPFVYVNLPEYRLYLHWADSVKDMKVCIGKNLPDNYDAMVKKYSDSGWLHRLPKNMETPQIASKIGYLVINPTWTIPYSIIRREMWGAMTRDTGYLRRKGYKVYLNDSEIVRLDTINWRRINPNKIPYEIVQPPGPENALGTVKFIFYNPFSIYLHDTPSKSAFKRTQRAVSHGCVRVEDPLLFGEYLMQNSKEYDPDDFRILMGFEPRTKERLKDYDPTDTTALIQPLEETTKVRLQTPMPVYLDYRTIYFDKEWKHHYAYDIYDQNRLILDEMDRQ